MRRLPCSIPHAAALRCLTLPAWSLPSDLRGIKDRIAIRLDVRDRPARSTHPGNDAGSNKDFVFLAFSVGLDGQASAEFKPESWPKGVGLATRRSTGGYTVEVRTPLLRSTRIAATGLSGRRHVSTSP